MTKFNFNLDDTERVINKITNDKSLHELGKLISNTFGETADKLTNQELIVYLDEIIGRFNSEKSVIKLYDNNSEYTDYPWEIINKFQHFFNDNNLTLGYHFIKQMTSSQYTFDDAIYAFIYKDRKYILELCYGQGSQFINLTDYEFNKKEPIRFDTEIWDFNEIGNWLTLSTDFTIGFNTK